ncbi:MAG: branched-chain amino acid ABC transporter permease [Betaproteobacteria bacterium]|nr:branched-chain amino acid ABC transporter permease [Betaproteobacteria bacterium]
MNEQVTVFLQHAFNGISMGAVYALIAAGITLVYGLSRIIHFAVGELVMLGAFIALSVWNWSGEFWLGLAVAVPALALIGLVTERAVFRFTLREPLTGFIVSLGLILILQGTAVEIWSPNPQYSQPPLEGSWDVAGVLLRKQAVVNFAIVVAVLALCYLVLMKTTFGKSLRAVSDDPGAAALMGIPVRTIIMTTFVIGSALAGIAGWMVLTLGLITPFVGAIYVLRGFAVALIGGLGNIQGAALAGIGLGVAESLAAGYVGPGWTDAYVFGAVVLILLWRPTGLAGGSEGAKL